MTNVLAVDADDVILDFSAKFKECISIVIGKEAKVVNKVWKLEDRYGLSTATINAAWDHFHSNNMWTKLDLLPMSNVAIENLQNNGYEIHIVTALDPAFLEARQSNLKHLGIEGVELHCAGLDSSKIDIFKKIKPVALFDDGHHNHYDALIAGIPHRVLIENDLDCNGDPPHTHEFGSLYEASNWFIELKNDLLKSKDSKISI